MKLLNCQQNNEYLLFRNDKYDRHVVKKIIQCLIFIILVIDKKRQNCLDLKEKLNFLKDINKDQVR